jgi:hypothetical protein
MKSGLWTLATVALVAAGIVVNPALGQGEPAKLLPADGDLEDYFGYTVAISGNFAVIGTPYDDDVGDGMAKSDYLENSGSAYVFTYDGDAWAQHAKLLAADGAMADLFGGAVAIDGDTIVIGAAEDDDNGPNAGSAYVFWRDGANWTQQAKLLPSDGAPDDLFGRSVALSGDAALIAMPGINAAGEYTGSAYVFRRVGASWIEETKLAAADGAAADLFGVRVALDGDTAVIGAPYDDDNGNESGSVYVFQFDGASWVQQQKLLAADGEAIDFFGSAIAVFGNTIVIGAPNDDDVADDAGAAYVFVFDGDGWVQQAKLTPSDGEQHDSFGASVASAGQTIVIGAPNDGNERDAAYVFHYCGGSWREAAKLTAPDGGRWDLFGSAVAVSADAQPSVLIGALRDDDRDINAGAAYVFVVDLCFGDLDGDNDVDLADLATLLSNYGTPSGAAYEDGDLDGDGDVDLADLSALLAHYGASCG